MTFTEKECPDMIKLFEFLDKAFLNALMRLKDDLKKRSGSLKEEEEATYKILKSSDFGDEWTGYIPKSYKNKKTGKVVEVTDRQVRLNFNFRTWPQKLSAKLRGKQISRLFMKRPVEELRANPDIKKYKPVLIDDKANKPTKVLKFNSGSFVGDLVIPGSFKVYQGIISLNAELGLICVTENPNGEKATKKATDDLIDEDEEEALNNATKTYNRTKPKSKNESDDDELENIPKKKQTNKKQVKKDDTSDEEEVSQKKKSNGKKPKKDVSDDDEEKPKKSTSKKPTTKKPASEDEKGSDTEDEEPKKSTSKKLKKPSSDDEVEEKPKKVTTKKPKKPASDDEKDSDFED
jgi:hypothetical protein